MGHLVGCGPECLVDQDCPYKHICNYQGGQQFFKATVTNNFVRPFDFFFLSIICCFLVINLFLYQSISFTFYLFIRQLTSLCVILIPTSIPSHLQHRSRIIISIEIVFNHHRRPEMFALSILWINVSIGTCLRYVKTLYKDTKGKK